MWDRTIKKYVLEKRSKDVGSHQSNVLFLKWHASLCFYHQVTNDIITLHMDKLWWSFWSSRLRLSGHFSQRGLPTWSEVDSIIERSFLFCLCFFSPLKTIRSRGQCCVWGERGPRRERWWLRPCPCRPEGEGHLEERQRERKENDRNLAGDRAGEGESGICVAWQQLGGLPLQVVYQEGKHHHSSTSRSTFTVNSFGGIKFTSKSFESHGFHAGL